MSEEPVRVGSMLFTMVDPNRGHEVAYNRWYERDHFYAGCMIGPGMLSGKRWVAPRRLKDLRFPTTSPFAEPVDAGSYLAIYWVNAGQELEWGDWASSQVWWLYENGRGFQERTHAQTGLYDFVSSTAADGHAVPITLALDHAYESLLVVVIEPPAGGSGRDLAAALDSGSLPSLLASGAAALSSSWVVRRPPGADDAGDRREQGSPMPLGASGGSPERVVQLLFSGRPPDEAWPAICDYAAALESVGAGTVSFAAPFLPTEVGTDRYTDELW
jgi:hypothetical protein